MFDDDCSLYRASRLFGKFRGKIMENFDLKMVSMEVKVFQVGMIVLYQRKYLLFRLLNLVHLEYMSVKSNMVVVRWWLGG